MLKRKIVLNDASAEDHPMRLHGELVTQYLCDHIRTEAMCDYREHCPGMTLSCELDLRPDFFDDLATEVLDRQKKADEIEPHVVR